MIIPQLNKYKARPWFPWPTVAKKNTECCPRSHRWHSPTAPALEAMAPGTAGNASHDWSMGWFDKTRIYQSENDMQS